MNQSNRRSFWPMAGLMLAWLATTAVATWILFPLAKNSQYVLLPWMPLCAIGLAAWRWPWRSQWQWSLDTLAAMYVVWAAMAAALTLWFAEPILLSLSSLLLALAICRAVVAENRWPLTGAWLPLVFPLVMLFGVDARLTRLHDRLVFEQNLTLIDWLAMPNDGLRTLPTDEIKEQYTLDYSGNPWSSWGNMIGLSLLVAGLFRRRGLHGILLASCGVFWAVIVNVIHNVGPFAARRFVGSVVTEPLLTADGKAYVLMGALLLILSADQFFKFALGEVEPDEDNMSLSGRVARFWNRLTSTHLTPRQSFQLRRASEKPVLSLSGAGLVIVMAAIFALRGQNFFERKFPTLANDIPLNHLQSNDERFLIREGRFERRAPGSRMGDRSWQWEVGGELGHALLAVDESPTAQRDLLHQLRLLDWRLAGSEEFHVESRSPNYQWTSARLDKAVDEGLNVRHHSLLCVAMAVKPPTSNRHPLTLVGRFPDWSGERLIAARWEGRLQRGAITIWLLADNFQAYSDEEKAAWQTLFVQFVDSLALTQ